MPLVIQPNKPITVAQVKTTMDVTAQTCGDILFPDKMHKPMVDIQLVEETICTVAHDRSINMIA